MGLITITEIELERDDYYNGRYHEKRYEPGEGENISDALYHVEVECLDGHKAINHGISPVIYWDREGFCYAAAHEQGVGGEPIPALDIEISGLPRLENGQWGMAKLKTPLDVEARFRSSP